MSKLPRAQATDLKELRKGDSGVPAIVYAAKSTEDKRGSLDTQIADCRRAAEAEGRNAVETYSDEARSAYHGSRGPQLAAAFDHAERLARAHGGAELWVQHSDRLARGDGKQAAHLAEHFFRALKGDVRLRSVEDDQTFGDVLYAVVTGQRNHEDSARKATATRAGLKRRKERGEPVGAIPLGYRPEPQIEEGQVVTRRVVDPDGAALVERIMSAVERGQTFGSVSRALNAEGARTVRGGAWSTRAVRRVVLNEDYTGTTGYPAIVDRDRWERIVAALTRLDPVVVQARKGGRPGSEDFILRGVAFCSACLAPMYTARRKSGRVYVCKNVRECTGLCDSPAIPAAPVERATLRHLADFKLDVRSWLADRAADYRAERAQLERQVDELEAEVRRIEARLTRAQRQYAELLDAGEDSLATTALRQIAGIEEDRDTAARRVDAAAARVAEWTAEPHLDAALDFYNDIANLIEGRIVSARGAAELNAALRSLLAGAWMWRNDHEGVGVSFVLRGENEIDAPPEDWVHVRHAETHGELDLRPSSTAQFRRGVPLPPLRVSADLKNAEARRDGRASSRTSPRRGEEVASG